MGNYLPMASQQQVRALLQLGWSHRRIARELGMHRETVSRYVRQQRAGPPVVIAGSEDEPVRRLAVLQNRPNPITGPPSLAAPYHEVIAPALERGLSAQRIWQDLIEEHSYGGGDLTVQRYVRALKRVRPEVADRLEHPPGEEILCGTLHSASLPGSPSATGTVFRNCLRTPTQLRRSGAASGREPVAPDEPACCADWSAACPPSASPPGTPLPVQLLPGQAVQMARPPRLQLVRPSPPAARL